jgi:hypothetical protein
MADIIPIVRDVDDASHFDLQAQLDGVTYTLEFRWNDRLGAWFMNVLDAEGVEAHMVGVRVVADYFFPRHLVDRSPPGLFLALDTGAAMGFGEDPGFDDLGSRVQLWYIPEAEI